MARTSKLLTNEVVSFAESKLKEIGKSGAVVIKLKAIIAARQFGITTVAKVFDTTKTTLISWIKSAKDGSLEQLTVQEGRGRKYPLTAAQEDKICNWIKQDSQMTIDKLKQKIMNEFNVNISRSSVHRIMKSLKFSYITARPKHYKQDTSTLPEAKKI